VLSSTETDVFVRDVKCNVNISTWKGSNHSSMFGDWSLNVFHYFSTSSPIFPARFKIECQLLIALFSDKRFTVSPPVVDSSHVVCTIVDSIRAADLTDCSAPVFVSDDCIRNWVWLVDVGYLNKL